MTGLAQLKDIEKVEPCCAMLASIFTSAGIGEPVLDARLLVQHACEIDHGQIICDPARKLTCRQMQTLLGLAERRLNGEPIARIFGQAEFWSLSFHLSKDTLVPRPDSETIIEQALSRIGERRNTSLAILDIGTGSGCLLLSLLSELPNSFGIGVDVSLGAVQTATANAQSLKLRHRAKFVCGSWFDALNGTFDLIVSNPPYIERGAINLLAPEVAKFDPLLALDGGADGLEPYGKIFSGADRLLSPGAQLIVEFGEGQLPALQGMLVQTTLSKRVKTTEIGYDLAGRARSLAVSVKP